MSQTIDRPPPRQSPAFVTTHWSVVLAASSADTPDSREAWEKFARTYWPPVYGFIRRSSHGPEDAQDLTQDFFFKLIDRKVLEGVSPGQGRFRSFLLVCLKHFLTDQHRRSQAACRRPKNGWLHLAAAETEAAYRAEQVEFATPEASFERQWAAALLDQAMAGLEEYYAGQGKGAMFDQLAVHLVGNPSAVPHAELAVRLKTSEGAIKNEMYRLRQRFRSLFREQVAATVPSEEVEEEMRYVLRVLSQ